MERKDGLIRKGGNVLFMLFIFLLVADPTNTILGLKMPMFALLVAYNLFFFRPDWSKLLFVAIPVVSVLLAWFSAEMQGNYVNLAELKAILFSFAPLLLLLWADRYDVVKLSILPVFITALIVVVLFWIIFFVPELEGVIYAFMISHDNTVMMSNRFFLGIHFFCMYCKSTAAFMPVFGFVLYRSLRLKNAGWTRIASVIITLVLVHLFCISGTRSSMLMPILLAAAILFVYCRNGRYMRYIFYPATFIFMCAFIYLLSMLLLEVDEPSNLVKYAHVTSYLKHFEANPIYMLIGQGPGTYFYSEGFHQMTMVTEWTYLELIRCYGIFSFGIFYVLLRPLYSLYKRIDKNESAFAILLADIIYLVIAGTNPLLLSSTGMLVVISVYSYIERLDGKGE